MSGYRRLINLVRRAKLHAKIGRLESINRAQTHLLYGRRLRITVRREPNDEIVIHDAPIGALAMVRSGGVVAHLTAGDSIGSYIIEVVDT